MAVRATLTTGDIVEAVTFVRTPEGQNQTNRTHWLVNFIDNPPFSITNFVDQMSTLFSELLIPIIPNTHTFFGTKARRVEPEPTQGVPSIEGQGVGDLTEDPLPSQVCGLISRRSSGAPPRHRGRYYVPSTGEGYNNTGGDPSAGYQTALADLNAFLRTTLVLTEGAAVCNLSPVIIHPNVGAGADVWVIDTCLTRTRWATQRRRGEINRPDVVPF